MSIKTRVQRLEEESGSGFQVAHPRELDDLGNRFERAPRDEQVAALRYNCAGENRVISKRDKETPRDFFARADQEAREHFQATVTLPAYVKWI